MPVAVPIYVFDASPPAANLGQNVSSKRPNPSSKSRSALKTAAKPRAAERNSKLVKTAAKPRPAPVKSKPATTKASSKIAATITSNIVASGIVIPDSYRPSDAEPFMNARQRAYFRNKLLTWKEDILKQNRETLAGMHENTAQYPDLTDRASSETDRALELRARDRQRKLIGKIDAALARIDDGSYGYCVETGEPIGLKRLDARPIATLTLEAQEAHERAERVHRED